MTDTDLVDFECRRCEGTGREVDKIDTKTLAVKKWGKGSCYTCSGRGMLRLSIPDTPTNCGKCQGTGRDLAADQFLAKGDAGWCSKCYGYGILSMTGKIKRLTPEGKLV